MKLNYFKIAKIVLPISIISIIVGYFLWTILIPIQDFNAMSPLELIEGQQIYALNYPLGRFLMITGFIGLLISIVYLINQKIRTRRN